MQLAATSEIWSGSLSGNATASWWRWYTTAISTRIAIATNTRAAVALSRNAAARRSRCDLRSIRRRHVNTVAREWSRRCAHPPPRSIRPASWHGHGHMNGACKCLNPWSRCPDLNRGPADASSAGGRPQTRTGQGSGARSLAPTSRPVSRPGRCRARGEHAGRTHG